jgi:hypothetical protein
MPYTARPLWPAISIDYRNLIKTFEVVFEKIVILFWGGHLKGPCSFLRIVIFTGYRSMTEKLLNVEHEWNLSNCLSASEAHINAAICTDMRRQTAFQKTLFRIPWGGGDKKVRIRQKLYVDNFEDHSTFSCILGMSSSFDWLGPLACSHSELIWTMSLRLLLGLLEQRISPSQGRYLHRTTQTQINIHTFSGIRTQDSSVREGEGISCLRPRGQCDRRGLLSSLRNRNHESKIRESLPYRI